MKQKKIVITYLGGVVRTYYVIGNGELKVDDNSISFTTVDNINVLAYTERVLCIEEYK
jgi:hypothetical protein